MYAQKNVDAVNAVRLLAESIEPERADGKKKYSKTGAGQYDEFDQFLGVRVPNVHVVAREFYDLRLSEVAKLFESNFNEHRMLAALIMVYGYQKNSSARDDIFEFYINTLLNYTTIQMGPDFVNKAGVRSGIDGWDIVDSSAHKIVGRHLADKSRDLLYELADHQGLWQNRVAMVATWWFSSKLGETKETFKLAEKFLNHPHDLMHKATGWMMREAGKKNESALTEFLDKHAGNMPRTMLRYSIERLSKEQRLYFMNL